MRRILVGYDGSEGGRRALDRAIAEAHESKAHITVISVENMPLDPEAPRHFGTLGDISAGEGAAFAAPPDVVQHLQEANERLNKAGGPSKRASARQARSSASCTASSASSTEPSMR